MFSRHFYRYIGHRDTGYLHKWSKGSVKKRGKVAFMPVFSVSAVFACVCRAPCVRTFWQITSASAAPPAN